jgi:hypothetical protein
MTYLPWISSDDSLVRWRLPRYQIQLDTPDGRDEWDDVAPDSEEASTLAAERLLRDYPELGTTTEDVAHLVGDAEIVHRYT